MKMIKTVSRDYDITCSTCCEEASASFEVTANASVKKDFPYVELHTEDVLAYGWEGSKEGGHYCPSCVEELREIMAQVAQGTYID